MYLLTVDFILTLLQKNVIMNFMMRHISLYFMEVKKDEPKPEKLDEPTPEKLDEPTPEKLDEPTPEKLDELTPEGRIYQQ